MNWNQHRPRRPRRAAPRQSYKPEFDFLERRTLLSGGLVAPVLGAPVQTGTATAGVVSPGAAQAGAAVVFSKDQLNIVPGGAGDSYTVVLATQPTADVTITILQVIADPLLSGSGGTGAPGAPAVPPSENGPLQVTPSTLTFTTDNWDTPQTVQVSAPADPADRKSVV